MSSSAGESERSFVSSAAILTVAQYAGAGVGFVTTLLAARWLGPRAFGVAAVVMAYPAAVSSFASVKTSPVTQRYASTFRARNRHQELLAVCKLGFVVDFAASILATALVLGTVLLVADLPGTHGNGELVALFALSLPFGSFAGTSFVVLFAFGRFGLAATLQVMQKLIVLIAVLTGLLIQSGTAAFVVGVAAGQAASGLIHLLVASALLGRAAGAQWWTASWSSLQGFGRELRSVFGWNFVGVTLSGAMSQVPVLLLGTIRSPVDAGYFRLASTIAVTADSLEAGMNRVAYPMLAAAQAKGDFRRIAQLIVAWSRREARFTLGAVLAGMALLPVLVLLVLGDRYMGMVPGAEMLLVGTAVSTAFFFVNPYLYSSGKVRTWVIAYGVYALGALGAAPFLAKSGGFFAIAAVVGIGLALLNIALGIPILRRAHRMTASHNSLVRATTASGLRR